MPRAVIGQGGPQPSEFTPAATGDGAAAATGSDAGDTQPRVGSPNDEQGQQAWQEWAEIDASGTMPLPVIPAVPAPLADVTAASPQGDSSTGSRRSPWKTLRARHQKTQSPAVVGEDFAELSQEVPPFPAGDGASVTVGVPAFEAAAAPAPVAAEEIPPEPARTEVPGETSGAGTGNDAPPMSGKRAPAVTRPDMFPAPPRAGGPADTRPDMFPAPPRAGGPADTRPDMFPVPPRAGGPADTRPDMFPAPRASGPARSGPEMFPAPPRARAPAQTRPDTFPAPRAGPPGTAPRAGPGQDQDDRVPLKPRPYVGARPVSQREKDLARRGCLRIRCTCAEPTICPAIAVKRKPASEAPAVGWQMPSAERVQQAGFTTLMSLAVASAATMPIPTVPGALAYPFATAGTMPLPVVPADVGRPSRRTAPTRGGRG